MSDTPTRPSSTEAARQALEAKAVAILDPVIRNHGWYITEGAGWKLVGFIHALAALRESPDDTLAETCDIHERLARAADAFVWNPCAETQTALRHARGRWQSEVGRMKLAAARGDAPAAEETTT